VFLGEGFLGTRAGRIRDAPKYLLIVDLTNSATQFYLCVIAKEGTHTGYAARVQLIISFLAGKVGQTEDEVGSRGELEYFN
jgi:hypothetical protein